ncbi:MAG: restriction endonuclease subunit S [Alphaproteobacteria bacterium]
MSELQQFINKNPPQDWSLVSLKRALNLKNGRDYKSVEAESGYPVIGSGGQFTYANDFLYNGEAVLLGRKGTLDKPLYVNEPFWTVDTMFYGIPQTGYDPKFIYYCATILPFDFYQSDTAIPSMSQSALNNHKILVPSYAKQKEISTFLDKEVSHIEYLISKKKSLISLMLERRVSNIKHLLTKGLDVSNSSFKNSPVFWIGKVPTHWDLVKLRHLVEIETGSRDTQDKIADGEYPFFVRSNTIERINSFSMDKEAVLTSGDGAGVGKIFHHYKGKFDFHQRVYAFINFNKITARFFYYFLSSFFQDQMTQYSAKSTVDSVRMPFLKSMVFTIPPISEQNEITSQLDKDLSRINDLHSKIRKSIKKLEELKKSLITEAVTGQLDIEAWKNRNTADRRLDKIEEEMAS